MRRRLTTVLLAVMMVAVYSIPALNPSVQSFATSETADSAIAWAKSQVGKCIDYDHAEGYQCVDLIKAYYDMLGVQPLQANANEYATKDAPSGWAKVKGGKPHKGDILVYGPGSSNPFGHVAIYESDYVTYHQNYLNEVGVVRKTTIHYKNFGDKWGVYWGCIRPNWSNSKVKIVYDTNGGTSIASEKVAFGKVFYTPAKDSTSKVGYTLAGFNGYRYKDDTYYVSGTGWIKASNISNYKKALYEPGSSHRMSTAWIYDGDFINYNKLRFEAVWKGINHTITFNANGGKGKGPSKMTVPTGKKFKIPSKGKLTKKVGLISYKFKGWTVVRNSDKKYYAKDGKWYANTKNNLKKHPAMVYKVGSTYTLGAKAWLSNSKKNEKTSFTFKAVWKLL